jgi:hypothetical protein
VDIGFKCSAKETYEKLSRKSPHIWRKTKMSDGPRIIEVAHSVKQRNVFIKLDDLGGWLKNQLDIDLYSSFFRYYTDDPNVGGVIASFGMDFDDAEKPERARREALTVITYLMDTYNIQERDISICFSGNKGFHVWVNHAVLAVEPHAYLPQIFKLMAKELTHQHGLKTLDLKVYDRRRLIRLPNTRHEKTGLYKISLTLLELQYSNMDKIMATATKPRMPKDYIPAKLEHQKSDKATAWLKSCTEAFMRVLEDKKTEFAEEDFKTHDFLPCVKKRLELGAEEGMRNRYAWQLASYFCKKGCPLEECLNIMRQWHSQAVKGLEPYTWEECEATIKATYEKGGYGIGCGSEYVEGLCIGKEKCPLFIKQKETEFSPETLSQAEEKLKSKPLEYIAETVNKVHVGDKELIQIAYISALSAQLTKPIHLWPIGTSQKGKSHVLYNVKNVLPREHYEIFTSASPKSLFYYALKYGENAFNGRLIYIDEIESSKLTLPLLRTLTSPTDIEPRHLSVYDADLLDIKIKGPRVIWFTSVKPFGAEQLRNRFVFVNPDETDVQDDKVLELQKKDENPNPTKTTEFQVAQAMTKRILEDAKALSVKIPYIQEITWPFKDKRWLFPIFKNFIKTIAKIHYVNREKTTTELTATTEDFETAKQLWKTFIKNIIYRVSRPAETVLDALPNTRTSAVTKAELAVDIGHTTQYTGRILQELLESEIINSEKPERAWKFWKAELPSTDDVKIKEGNEPN